MNSDGRLAVEPVTLSPEQSAAVQAAVEWLLRCRETELTAADRREFVRWLRLSPVHVSEFLRVTSTHKALTRFKGWSETIPIAAGVPNAPEADTEVRLLPGVETWGMQSSSGDHSASQKKLRVWARVATTLAAAFAVVVIGLLWWAGLVGGAVYVTRPGELRTLTLRDGSELRLAAGSRVRIKFRAEAREVILSRGEALFRVTKDPDRPFIVHAGKTLTRAVGTAFAVRREANSVVVTVREGRVVVSRSGDPTLPFLQPPTIDEVSLTANQQIISSEEGQLERVRQIDSQRVLSWAQGELIFDNETVSAIATQFNRFARIQLRITDRRVASRTVSGVFDASDPESFATFLASVERVKISRIGPDQIVVGPVRLEDGAQVPVHQD